MTDAEYMKQLALGQSSMHLWLASQQQVIKPADASSLLTDSMSLFESMKPSEAIVTKEDLDKHKHQETMFHQAFAQMTLGYRYSQGVGGVRGHCRTAFLYFEPAAYQATQHVLKTKGL